MTEKNIDLSENALNVLTKRCFLKDKNGNIIENWPELVDRVCSYISKAEKTPELQEYYKQKFKEIVFNLRFLPNSPCLANANLSSNMMACFVIPIEDSMEAIFECIRAIALVHKSGGGTGTTFTSLRPEGDLVKGSYGVASGPLSFMDIINVTTETVKQGGKRRGANMGILRIDHPDIEKFITIKNKEGLLNNFNLSVAITDNFMSKVIECKKKKEDYFAWDLEFNGKIYKTINGMNLWNKIVEGAHKKGEPGIIFIDTINRLSTTKGYQVIEATNPSLCFKTPVLTPNGYFPIGELEGKSIEIFNINGDIQNAICFKSGINKRLWELSTKLNGDFYCTKEHKWPTQNGKKETQSLNIGDLIPLAKNNNLSKDGYDEVISIKKTNKFEDVYDITVFDDTNTFQIASIITGNCGESPLASYEACCLGSINLGKFVMQNGDVDEVDWRELESTVKVAVRFLDNLIDMNHFPLPEIEKETKKFRKIGLGVMGWEDMLIKLKTSYNSQEALGLAERVMGFINEVARNYSEELAKEKGFGTWEGYTNPDFPIYKDIDMSLFERRNANVTIIAPTGSLAIISDCAAAGIEPIYSFEFKKRCLDGEMIVKHPLLYEEYLNKNHTSAYPYRPDYFVESKDVPIKQHIRMQAAFQRHTDGAVSKCISLDSLIVTDQGLKYLKDISNNRTKDSFSDVDGLKVITEDGINDIKKFYYNGFVKGKKITTRNGMNLSGTNSHKIRVLTEFHDIEWKNLNELTTEDFVVIPLGTNITDTSKSFNRYIKTIIGKTFETTLKNTKEIKLPEKTSSELFWWLGCVQADGYVGINGVHLTQVEGEVLSKWCEVSKRLFGIEPSIQNGKRDNLKEVNLTSRVLRDWMNYIGFSKFEISPLVLNTGRKGKLRYIEGCTLDGYCTESINLKTDKSLSFIEQLQLICLDVGIPTYIMNSYNKTYKRDYYLLNIQIDFVFTLIRFFRFPEKHKQENLIRLANRKRVRDNGQVSFILVNDNLPIDDNFISILDIICEQYKYSPRLRDSIFNQRILARNNRKLSLYQIIKMYSMANRLPEIFKDKFLFTRIKSIDEIEIETADIEVEKNHSYIANGFISHNTINAPSETTIKEVDDAFIFAYQNDIKGLTFYRQGSREYEAQIAVLQEEKPRIVEGQNHYQDHIIRKMPIKTDFTPIKTKELPPEKVEQARAAIGRLAKNYRKNSDPDIETPEWLPGWREKIKTGDGTLWVHVFTDPSTGFREVWTAVSKPGRTLAAAADSTGRLITLALKKGASWDEIVKQLQGHIGEKTAWNNGVQVLSIQDGTAQVLRRRCIEKNIPMVECPFEFSCHKDELEVVEAIEDKSRIIYQSQEEINSLHEFGERVAEKFMDTDLCPDCGSVLLHDEGCKGGRCGTCGFSHCS